MAKKEKEIRDLYTTPVLKIVDNLIFSKDGVWAYYKISERPYDFLSNDSKINLAKSTLLSLSSLCNSTKGVDLHILVTNTPFDPTKWTELVENSYGFWQERAKKVEEYSDFFHTGSTEVFQSYVQDTAMELYHSQYLKRVSYLGVKLFDRKAIDFNINVFELGFAKAKTRFRSAITNLFKTPDDVITKDEEEKAIQQENSVFQLLKHGNLAPVKPDTKELLLTMKKIYYPGMPSPYLEVDHENRIGLNDILVESGGEIHVGSRIMKLVQNIDGKIFEGYRTTLTISKLPDKINIPSYKDPLFYRASLFPFTTSARVTLLPSETMKKKFYDKKLESQDELKNLDDSGQDMTTAVAKTQRDLNTLEKELEDGDEPWAIGSYRITVDGASEEFIDEVVTSLKQEFKQDEIILLQTTGDQLDLFREEQMGGETIVKDFQQTTNLAIMAALGFNFGTDVGDPIVDEV